MVDPVIELTPIFIFPLEFWTTPMTGRADRGASRLHELPWHVGRVWGHRMISVPWPEVAGGGGIGRPPNSSLYGEEDFPWMYGEKWSPRSSTVATPHRDIGRFAC